MVLVDTPLPASGTVCACTVDATSVERPSRATVVKVRFITGTPYRYAVEQSVRSTNSECDRNVPNCGTSVHGSQRIVFHCRCVGELSRCFSRCEIPVSATRRPDRSEAEGPCFNE